MRILLVHNFYGSTAPSGENKVFEAERQMLDDHGEKVDVYLRHSDEIRVVSTPRSTSSFFVHISYLFQRAYALLKGALCTVGNPFAARALARKIREFKPDVVHFHNQFPLISPLAIRAAHKSGTKVVMTLHNYRTVCAAGVPARDGHVCTECFREEESWKRKEEGGQIKESVHCSPSTFTCSVRPALRHRCYRDSLLATLPLAISIWLYRKCWAKWVDRFIVLSEFQKKVMTECGFSEEKIVVKGNFVRRVERGECVEKKKQVLYVGRLSDEKGVRTLIEAWRILCKSAHPSSLVPHLSLLIIGDGEKRLEYEKLAEGSNIQFLGQKPHDEVLKLMAESRCIVQPSACWETFGLTVAESMSVGTPAVVSDVGALPDLLGCCRGEHRACGEAFRVGDENALTEAIRRLLGRKDYEAVCAACKERVVTLCSEKANYRQMKEIYTHCAEHK